MASKEYKRGQPVCLDGIWTATYYGPSFMFINGRSREVGRCVLRKEKGSILEEHYVNGEFREVVVHDKGLSAEYEELEAIVNN